MSVLIASCSLSLDVVAADVLDIAKTFLSTDRSITEVLCEHILSFETLSVSGVAHHGQAHLLILRIFMSENSLETFTQSLIFVLFDQILFDQVRLYLDVFSGILERAAVQVTTVA